MKTLFNFFLFFFSSKKSSFQEFIDEMNKKYSNTGLQFDEYGNPVWDAKIRTGNDH